MKAQKIVISVLVLDKNVEAVKTDIAKYLAQHDFVEDFKVV